MGYLGSLYRQRLKPHPAEHFDDLFDFGVFSEKIGKAKLLG
jgi:hypothetical protein